MLFFGLFQFVLLLSNCLLICFTEKDSVEEMLIKSGTIGNGRVPQVRPRRRRSEEKDDAESVGTRRRHEENGDAESAAPSSRRRRHEDNDDAESVGTSVHTHQTRRGQRGGRDDNSIRNV